MDNNLEDLLEAWPMHDENDYHNDSYGEHGERQALSRLPEVEDVAVNLDPQRHIESDDPRLPNTRLLTNKDVDEWLATFPELQDREENDVVIIGAQAEKWMKMFVNPDDDYERAMEAVTDPS